MDLYKKIFNIIYNYKKLTTKIISISRNIKEYLLLVIYTRNIRISIFIIFKVCNYIFFKPCFRLILVLISLVPDAIISISFAFLLFGFVLSKRPSL